MNSLEQLEAAPSLYEGDGEVHRIAIRGRAVGNLPHPDSDESRRKTGQHAPTMTRAGTSRLRKSYLTEREFRRIRVKALLTGLIIHFLVVITLFILWEQKQNGPSPIADFLFGSGGGGGEDEQDYEIRFGPQSNPDQGKQAKENSTRGQFNLIDLYIYSDIPHAQPVIRKEAPKPVAKKKKVQQTIIAENLPTRWVRHGSGPGSGGGAGGGSGGGIGKNIGYSIDWGGAGSRRLLSGLYPQYPRGTDRQMVVVLQFTVLPDGTVDAIIPARKTDELLEGASISALKTWRFDPLPSQMEPKSQTGKVAFNFKLEVSH